MAKDREIEIIDIFDYSYHNSLNKIYTHCRVIDRLYDDSDGTEKLKAEYMEVTIPIDDLVDIYERIKNEVRRHYEEKYIKTISKQKFNDDERERESIRDNGEDK